LINIFSLLSVVLTISFGCSKEKDDEPANNNNNNNNNTVDSIPPIIYRNSNDTFWLVLNWPFVDPGATANDLVDGNIIPVVSGSMNKDSIGYYTITYTATDLSGNSGSVNRIVHVYNQMEAFDGVYTNCTDSCQATPSSVFTATVTSSATMNKVVTINNFGGFGNQVIIQATITGSFVNSPVSIPASQSLGGGASRADLCRQLFCHATTVSSRLCIPDSLSMERWS